MAAALPSFYGDIQARLGADAVAAFQEQLRADEREQLARQLEPLRQFGDLLTEEEMVAELNAANGNVDEALLACFNKHQEKVQQRDAAAREAQRIIREQERKAERRRRAAQQVAQIFGHISEEQRNEFLDQADGDVDAAVDALIAFNAKRDADQAAAAAAQREAEREYNRHYMIAAVQNVYPTLPEEEIRAAVIEKGEDLEAVLNALQQRHIQVVRERLCAIYTLVPAEEVHAVLSRPDIMFDEIKARKDIALLQLKHRTAQEKREADAAGPRHVPSAPASIREEVPTPPSVIERAPSKVEPVSAPASIVEPDDDLAVDPLMLRNSIWQARVRVEQDIEEQKQEHKEEVEKILFVRTDEALTAGDTPAGDRLPTPVADSGSVRPDGPAPADGTTGPAFAAGPRVVLSVPACVEPGATFDVSWRATEAVNTDWIAMAPFRAPDAEYFRGWQWNAKAEKEGSLKFTAPTDVGKYELRYLPNRSYTACERAIVCVGPRFTLAATRVGGDDQTAVKVSWTQEGAGDFPNKWIAMYASPDAPAKDFAHYIYCGAGAHGEVQFNVKRIADTHFRLFASKSYIEAADAVVRMSANDSVDVVVEDGRTRVSVNLLTRDPATEKIWAGLYETNATSGKYRRSWKVPTLGASSTMWKTPIHNGEYHVRLFSNGYNEIARSTSTIVVADGLPPMK